MAKKLSTLREINLEAGMPTVEQALKRLAAEIPRSWKMGCTILKIIHGYGSSGTGGKIRTASRKYLAQCREWGDILGYIPGEKFSIFEEETRQAFLRCPDLRSDHDLDRYNRGVTFILL